MKILLIAAATIAIATTAFAETDTFDKASTGSLPTALTCGVTGRGQPKWTIEADSTAPSQPNVQAGGIVWRWKNGNNYYVARANALENNVSLYYTEKGR